MWIENLVPIKTIVGFFNAIVVASAIIIHLNLAKNSPPKEIKPGSDQLSEFVDIAGRGKALSVIHHGLIFFIFILSFAVLFGLFYGMCGWLFLGSISYMLSIFAIFVILFTLGFYFFKG